MEIIWILVGLSVVVSIIVAAQQQSAAQPVRKDFSAESARREWLLQQHALVKPGRDLATRFAELGTLSGCSKKVIIEAVGPPNAVSAMPHGKTLLQWQRTGYHIALLFDADVCEGVTHEYRHHDEEDII